VEVPLLMIRDLIPGLNDVAVIGRIVGIFSTRTFSGVKQGKFASLLVADRCDLLRIVLWNDKTDLIESGTLRVGQIVRFSHGYTREDSGGKAELHLGEKSVIETNPEGLNDRDYPNILRFSKKIVDLTPKLRNKRVNIVATVQRIFSPSVFEREDSSSGKVMRVLVDDGSGEIPVVAWNEKVDEVEKSINVGDRIQVVNGKVRKALGEGFEISVDGSSYVGLLTWVEEFCSVADMKEGMGQVNVEGEVVTRPVLRDVRTRGGENLKLATFEFKDETGSIQVSAWRQHAEFAGNMCVGDRVVVRNVYVKRGFDNQLELSTRSSTVFERA
jgi:ssDNA-binding replication factor A large subunit